MLLTKIDKVWCRCVKLAVMFSILLYSILDSYISWIDFISFSFLVLNLIELVNSVGTLEGFYSLTFLYT